MDEQNYNQNTRQAQPRKRSITKFIIIRVLILIIIIGVLFGGTALIIWYKNRGSIDVSTLPYSAVFLSNGQVYFGKINMIKDGYMILSGIYYISGSGNQSGQNPNDATASSLSLVKLGQEIHGPTDMMYVSSANILFYENLRPDSKVVQSIESHAASAGQ